MVKYNYERWKKLCHLIEIITSSEMNYDTFALKELYPNKEDWEFIVERLVRLGLIHWRDLGITSVERDTGINLAMKSAATKEGLEQEIELLNAIPQCVAGFPLRPFAKPQLADFSLLDEVLPPSLGFCQGWCLGFEGKPIMLLEETDVLH